MRSLAHVSSCTVRANLTPSNPRTPHCVRRAVSEFAFTGKPLRGLRKTKEDLKFLFSKRSVESTKRKIGVAGKIAAITAEAIVGDMMDEEHREYYALATRRGATLPGVAHPAAIIFTMWLQSLMLSMHFKVPSILKLSRANVR